MTNVADPLGGSWFVESLTDELEAQAESIFAHLLELGDGSVLEGVHAGIDNGWFQGEIADSAYHFERQLNRGERVLVGANAFTEGSDDASLEILQITAEQEQQQVKRLGAVKADRDAAAVRGGAGPGAGRRRRCPTSTSCRRSSTRCAPTPPKARSWRRWPRCSVATSRRPSSEPRGVQGCAHVDACRCPSCGSEYVSSVEHCLDCDVELVGS